MHGLQVNQAFTLLAQVMLVYQSLEWIKPSAGGNMRKATSRMRRAATTILMLSAVLVATPSQALQIFTDRALWQDAVSGAITTDPFDNPIAAAVVINLDSGIVSTGIGSGTQLVDNGVYVAAVDTDGAVSDFESITWDFPYAITAFGADWGETATAEGLLLIGDFDGTGSITINFFTELVDNGGTGFLGIIGNVPFNMITFESGGVPESNIINEAFYVDNVAFVAATQVPEPATLALLGLGLLGIGFARRRRQ